jgi:hypothetical protein
MFEKVYGNDDDDIKNMIIHIVDNARWVFIFCLAYAKYVFNLTNNITLTQDDFSVLY